jgi:hypothetical protein
MFVPTCHGSRYHILPAYWRHNKNSTHYDIRLEVLFPNMRCPEPAHHVPRFYAVYGTTSLSEWECTQVVSYPCQFYLGHALPYCLVLPFIQEACCVLKAKAVPLHAMKGFGGEEVQLLLILDLGTGWGWVVSVTPRPRFSPGYPLYWRLGGPQSRTGHRG